MAVTVFAVKTGIIDTKGIETIRMFETLSDARRFAMSIGATQVAEMEISKCCCKHPDARKCLVARSPVLQRRDDGDIRPDEFIFEQCECECHREIESD